MKTVIGVFFGGRSVEHEISVISALQAIAALDTAKYEAVPIYITKSGKWLTGKTLLDSANYRNLDALEEMTTRVCMRPELGNRTLYRKRLLSDFRFRSGDVKVTTLDVALPVFHGTNGEDGTFQGLLELIGIPYAGCGVLASALGMDKIAMKMILRESGLPVIDYVWFTDREWARTAPRGTELRADTPSEEDLVGRIEGGLGYPVIVKPANLGSSVGISRARNRVELIDAVRVASQYSSRILVERMVEPLREINCSVLGSADDLRTSVCEEPVRSDEILSYADKYLGGRNADGKLHGKGGGGWLKASVEAPKGGGKFGGTSAGGTSAGGAKIPEGGMSSTQRRIPADLPAEMTAEIQRLAGETFRVLGCDGVARIDFILDGNAVYINEINTIPGSLSFYLWEASGLSFGALLDTLIACALKRDRDRSHKTVSYAQNIFSLGPK